MAGTEAPHAPSAYAAVIAALREILADGQRFVRAEMGLARAEGTAAAKRAAIAAGLLAANVPEAVELPGLTRCATGGRAPGPRPVQA